MSTVYKNYTVRTLRNVNLLGNPEQEIKTERDARVLLTYLMKNIPASTFERMTELLEEFNSSPEPSFTKFMKELKDERE